MKKIVILGAGYAGILTAKKLAKKLKKHQDVEITIIDKNPFHTMLTELHEVAAGRVDEDSIKISLEKVFAGRNVNIKLDMIKEVDVKNKIVIGESHTYDYDYLVIAAGSKPTYYGVPGVEEHTFKLWSYEDAVLLNDHIVHMFRKACCERDEKKRKDYLTFCVIGAGFTGVEMIGELAEYVPILCEKFEIDPKEVSLLLVDALERPVVTLPEKLSAKVTKRLEKMGVECCMGASVQAVGTDFIELTCKENHMVKPMGTLVWAAGIQSADIVASAGEKLESGRGGRIPVDSYLRSTKDSFIYVVGDSMHYIPEGQEMPVPQMVENCEQSAEIAAHNILSEVIGHGEMKAYQPSFHGVMVCIGGRYGVANVGLPGHFISLPSFLAMFSKHFINIIYFLQVLGWNKIFSYIRHEFFTIRNCRSFVGGHFSNRTPSFLLVPLRFWLGAVWLFEGVMKIIEGWFDEPKLTGFFGGARGFYEQIINPESADALSAATSAVANTAADAVSAATGVVDAAAGAVAATGEVIFNLDVFGLLRMVFVSGTEISHSTLSDLAFWIDIPLMNQFMDKFILPNDGVQVAMQIFIVVAEILVGLALMGGLFTTPAAAFSIVLQMMFVTTTGLYLGTFWMIFAGIAVLIGAGRTMGLDYYVMPQFKKLWKKIPFVKKSYLYHD